ncbi:hypothetical protein [Paenibacillus sp. N3.4]|uniref:hypothetical protein n=1 Tax=Paenibacillus sp. N3.4 TaxID=2603222 RepID=UPI0016503379|nr:hypothetical protein [Paenibacillus sp. N3.4]
MLKRSLSIMLTFSILMSIFVVAPAVSNAADGLEPSTGPLGPNVYVFDQNTPASDIQRITAEVFKRQEASEFGNDRYALFFKPGTYQTDIRVGFYTHVAGLGQSPDDVTIKGDVTVDALWWNQPVGNATKNFWRSAENFTIEPTSVSNKWAVAQAVPFRRMHVKGDLKLHDGGWASGGYMADSKVDGRVEAGGQQQWFSRNSVMNDWSGGQWNNVFLGDNFGTSPANTWPATPNTIVNQTPINREKPFLTVDGSGAFQVFVPGLQSNTKGTSWSGGASQGKSIPLDQFYVASPDKSDAATINAALAAGKNLLLTPGIYHLNDTIRVTRPDTVVLGIGFATLMPHNGVVALSVDDVDGVTIAGLLFDAGSESSPALMEVGPSGSSKDHSANPTLLQDLFFRVGGGPVVGRADTSIKINSNNVIGDHFWVWRADHGTDVKWNLNTTTNGLVVNGMM